MVCVMMNKDDLAWAEAKAKAFKRPKGHDRRLEKEDTQIIGYYGERAFLKHFGGEHIDGSNGDCLLEGCRIEVKSYKMVKPMDRYKLVYINEAQITQRRLPDYYVWAFCDFKYQCVWFPGWIGANELHLSKKIRAGEKLPYTDHTLIQDCRVIEFEQLNQYKEGEKNV